jgi:hypothetical protein
MSPADMPTPRGSRRIRIRHITLVLALVVLGPIYVPALLWHPSALEGEAPQDGWTRVGGVLHMHTTYSDGSGPPEELVAAARRLGLRFVAITDHNNFGAKLFEGYHDGVLVMVGCEASTRTGHIVGLGIEPPAYRFSGDARDTISDILHLGGLAIVAHPLHSGESDWQEWDMPGPWAMELVNGKSQWVGVGARRARTLGRPARPARRRRHDGRRCPRPSATGQEARVEDRAGRLL